MASFKFLLYPLLIFEFMLLVTAAIDHRSDVNNFNTYGTLAPRHKGSYRRHHRHEHENEGNFAISGLKNLRKILIPTPPAEQQAGSAEVAEVVPQLKRKGNVALTGLRKLLLTTAAKEEGSPEVVAQLKRKGNVALTGLRKILLTTPAKVAGSAELGNTDAGDGSNPNAIQSNAADDGSNPTDVQSNTAGDDTAKPQPEHHEISNVKKRINALNNYLHFLKRNGKAESIDGPDGSGVGTPADTENGNFEHFSHESHDGDEVSHHKMSFNVMMKKGGQYERYDKGHNLPKIFGPRLDELTFMGLANPNPPGSCCQPPPQTPTVCCVQPTNPPVITTDQPTEPVEESRTENAHPDPFPYISQEQTPYRLENGVSRSNEEEKPYKSEEETPYRKPSNEESKEASPEVTTEPPNLSIETTTYQYVSDEESVESKTESNEEVEQPTENPESDEKTTEKCPTEDHTTEEPQDEPTQPSYQSEEASAEVSTEQPPNPPVEEPSNPSAEEPSNPSAEEPSNPPTEAPPSAENSAEKPKEDSQQASIEQTTAPPYRPKENPKNEGWIKTQTVIRKIKKKKTVSITQTASDGPSSPEANVDDVGIEGALKDVDPSTPADSQGSNESSSNTESIYRKMNRKKTTTTTQTSSNEQPSSPEVNVDSPNNENVSQESVLRRILRKKTTTTTQTSNEKSSPEVIVHGASDEGTEKIVEKIKPWISDRNISIFAFSSKNLKHNSNNTGDDGSITKVQTNQKDMKGVVLKALSSLDDETKNIDEPPKFPFSEIEPKFKGYQDRVNDLATKSGKLCPELHPLKLIQDWSSTFKSAWPHFSQMKDVCLKYAEDLKLQLALCLDNVIHKKYGNRLPSDAGKGEEQDGQKFKRELEDQQKFVSTFNSEYMNPLVDMFAKMPELVHKANLK